MKKISRLSILLLFSLLTVGIKAQSVIINEIYNSSASDEWIELLVVQDALDMRGFSIRDFSSSGTAQAPLNLTSNALWSSIRKGTIIVVARPENTFAEDLDASDNVMVIKTSNSLYCTGNPFVIAGSSEAIEIRDASSVHIFGVSWGANNANSLTTPKAHLAGPALSSTSIFFNEDDVAKASIATNWTMSGPKSMGIGNTTNNLNWIASLRARSEGSGTLTFSPLTANGSSQVNLTFKYVRDTKYSINSIKIIFPSEFLWSGNLSDVQINNFTGTNSISGDTVSFSAVSFSQDSISISITNVTTPTFTGYYKFDFLTGEGTSLGPVTPLPIMTVSGAAIPISDAKVNDVNGLGLRNGDLVTVRGIVSVANEFGSPGALQDNSGGISIFGSSFSDAVKIGDEVIVTGRITQFNGLNQLETPTVNAVLSSGNHIEPVLVTASELSNDGKNGIENYEGRLVRVNGVSVTELNGSPVTSWAYQNYMITGDNAADTVQLRIDNQTPMIGTVAPAGKFDVVGVLSQYKTAAPFIGGYQLMPRIKEDIISNGPIISRFPEEVSITANSITISWGTVNPGTSRIRYGKTNSYELGVLSTDDNLTTDHVISLSGLTPATIYHMQAFSVANSDTSFSSDIISSSSSDASVSGEINVYFNNSVDTRVSSGSNAKGNFDLKAQLVKRINNAKRSIDGAIYSLSGTVGADIATALVNAKNRGVKVRMICENDNRTTAPWTTLNNNSIPIITDTFGNNDGGGLMHNKFWVIDYRGGAADSVWVMTGSWNATDPGTNSDRQNAIEFQDVALAGAYEVEFEEMWGGSGDNANAQNSRFGLRKLNNTPHKFVIGGRMVESYFSPSDRTTSFIGKTIGKGKNTIDISMLTITRKELADSVISLKKRGSKARVIMDNNTDTGNQFAYLQTGNVDVMLKGGSGLLHHKYAIVDGEGSGTPYLITGSHNWSSSAENSNDENTVIIQDASIANEYLQEFTARYYEAGGKDSIYVGVEENSVQPNAYALEQNYPNPFNPTTTIRYSLKESGKVELTVFNMLGQRVATLVNEFQSAGNHAVKFDASHLASGIYVYRMHVNNFSSTRKLILLK